jgi:hypothetical protein
VEECKPLVGGLLDSLGPSVRVVCLQETKLTSRSDLDVELACPAGWVGRCQLN